MTVLSVFDGATVLVTGHTGFKGSWLTLWLSRLGAKIYGLSHDVPTSPSHYDAANISLFAEDHRLDIRDEVPLRNLVVRIQPDFVFHLAAQSLVRPSYKEPLDTLNINGLGTANVLNSLRYLNKPVVAIMITSDKAYDNCEWVWGYRETDRLGGRDPYSASKGIAELVIRCFVESYFMNSESQVSVGITRAGNVIGGGDWALDRIVPDCMRAWSLGKVVDIRSPFATRPWQHVLEPLSGYLTLAALIHQDTKLHGEAFNFGPPANQNQPVCQLITEMSKHWDNVRWNDVSGTDHPFHEAALLKLNCDKALANLRWQPTMQFEETVKMTVNWYKEFYDIRPDSMYELSSRQIDEYTALARERGLSWAK